MDQTFDLLVIGGGINGAGIARDAAGRGLAVAICDQGDFGGATSSASSKLIHGGLRYLEHYAFRLVAESLAEREVLLAIAPHLARPLRFLLPHSRLLRPAWMISAGLQLYDSLGRIYRRRTLPASCRVDLTAEPAGIRLRPEYRIGFAYSDVATDDARLTLANVRDAADRGAQVMPRCRFVGASRAGGAWIATLEEAGGRRELRARALVNAAGPWVDRVLGGVAGSRNDVKIRLVRGSHIVVPRLYAGNHAYTLQNDDGRVCFLIPFQRNFSLIGTTEVDAASPEESTEVSPSEVEYLCRAVNRYAERAIAPDQVAWSYAGVRPLIDDGHAAASAVSREYRLELDCGTGDGPPVLSVFGGKLTTYRRLAENALAKLAPWFPQAGVPWTDRQPLPGGNLDGRSWSGFLADLSARYPDLPATWLVDLAARHGSRCDDLLASARTEADLGRNFGGGLYEREVEYSIAREWARRPEDVLWRRTKCGLTMSAAECVDFAEWFRRRLP